MKKVLYSMTALLLAISLLIGCIPVDTIETDGIIKIESNKDRELAEAAELASPAVPGTPAFPEYLTVEWENKTYDILIDAPDTVIQGNLKKMPYDIDLVSGACFGENAEKMIKDSAWLLLDADGSLTADFGEEINFPEFEGKRIAASFEIISETNLRYINEVLDRKCNWHYKEIKGEQSHNSAINAEQAIEIGKEFIASIGGDPEKWSVRAIATAPPAEEDYMDENGEINKAFFASIKYNFGKKGLYRLEFDYLIEGCPVHLYQDVFYENYMYVSEDGVVAAYGSYLVETENEQPARIISETALQLAAEGELKEFIMGYLDEFGEDRFQDKEFAVLKLEYFVKSGPYFKPVLHLCEKENIEAPEVLDLYIDPLSGAQIWIKK